jgi:hypothetical protein
MTACVSVAIVVLNPKAFVLCSQAETHPLGQIPGAMVGSAKQLTMLHFQGRLTVIVAIVPDGVSIYASN